MIPGGASHTTLEKIGYLQQVADDPTRPDALRAEADAGLERIEAGEPVHPTYQAIRDADATARQRREAELQARAEAAVARAKSRKKSKQTPLRSLPLAAEEEPPARYPVRAFVQTWGELSGWWTHYDADDLATQLTDEQVESFLTTAEGTSRFADDLRTARARDEEEPGPPLLRAL